MTMPEKQKYEDLNPEQQKEAAVFALAGLIRDEAEEVPHVGNRESVLAFADLFYPQLRVLASDTATSRDAHTMGRSTAFLARSAEGRPEAVTLRLEAPDTQLLFSLPNPNLIRADHREWSPDSMPGGSAVLHMDEAIEPLRLDFGCFPDSDAESLSNYADSIRNFSEFIVEASTPPEEQAL